MLQNFGRNVLGELVTVSVVINLSCFPSEPAAEPVSPHLGPSTLAPFYALPHVPQHAFDRGHILSASQFNREQVSRPLRPVYSGLKMILQDTRTSLLLAVSGCQVL